MLPDEPLPVEPVLLELPVSAPELPEPIEPVEPELPEPIEPVEPELPEENPPMEPLDPELPEEPPMEPFGMISMFVTLLPEKLART